MKLIIVRHAETIENSKGIIQGHKPGTLSSSGIKQAKKLAKELESEVIQNIYSSDLARAADTTAEIIKYHPGAPVRFLKILRERNLGELEGKQKDEIVDKFESDKNSVLYTEEGETVEDLLARSSRILDLVLSAHPDDTVLLVIHGGTAKALISTIEKKGKQGYIDLPRLDNAGISCYEIDENLKFRRIVYNKTQHLDNS